MIFQNKKRHNSGAADLEKVTDYAEEKEILSTSTDLDDAIAVIRRLYDLLVSLFADSRCHFYLRLSVSTKVLGMLS